jgi:hypothetical protein
MKRIALAIMVVAVGSIAAAMANRPSSALPELTAEQVEEIQELAA